MPDTRNRRLDISGLKLSEKLQVDLSYVSGLKSFVLIELINLRLVDPVGEGFLWVVVTGEGFLWVVVT